MPAVTVQIAGVANEAVFTWDGDRIGLADAGGGNWGVTFDAPSGLHVYAVVVLGRGSDPWNATVNGGVQPNFHAGVMSPGGMDATGDTPIEVA